MSEHAAHYLQQVTATGTGRRREYRSTCDCGWFSAPRTDPNMPILDYSRHVGYTPEPPTTPCPPSYIYVDGVRYRRED